MCALKEASVVPRDTPRRLGDFIVELSVDNSRVDSSAATCLKPCGDLLDLAPDTQQVAAPDLRDLLLGITPPHKLERDVEGLRSAVPAFDAPAAVEIRGDADVVDSDQLHRVVDVIDVVLDRRASSGGPLAIDLGHASIELGASIGG